MGTDGQPEPKPKWTVMLYMAASKDQRTEQAAIRDLRELEGVGTTKNVNVIVQIDRDWPGYAERYCVRKGFSEILAPPLLQQRNIPCGTPEERSNSGKPDVLKEFVAWGRKEFPAERYLLVLWGHSYGLGFGRDHGDALTLGELAKALSQRPDGRNGVDILGANACAMSYAEAAYELKDAADFFVGPEITMPFAGWPYERILNAIGENPEIEPKALGERIIQEFMASFEQGLEPQSVAMTLLDLGKASGLKALLTTLTAELKAAIQQGGVRETIADAFLETAHGDVRPLIDLRDLCGKLAGIKPPDAVTGLITAAEALRAFLEPATGTGHPRPAGRPDGFVVEHQAGRDLEGLEGVGIFAPSVTGAADLMRLELSRAEYDKLTLPRETGWAELAYKDLKDLLGPMNRMVAEFVNGSGATNLEDRTGVAQLLVGIYQSFVSLDKTVAQTQTTVMDALTNGAAPKTQSLPRPGRPPVASRFAPPFLRLAPSLRQPQYSELVASASVVASSNTANVVDPVKAGPFDSVADSLANLEDALAKVERTAKRVMTHASLGLGADPGGKFGLGADPGGKFGLGADPGGKFGLGADPGGKFGLGADPGGKFGLGRDPGGKFGLGRGYVAPQDVGSQVVELYGQVAWSLQLIEEAVARLEDLVQGVVTGSTNGSREDKDYRKRLKEQVTSSFRELAEVTTNAKRTSFSALGHPAYGLGPIQPGLGRESPEQLATVGGLSSRVLRLL